MLMDEDWRNRFPWSCAPEAGKDSHITSGFLKLKIWVLNLSL